MSISSPESLFFDSKNIFALAQDHYENFPVASLLIPKKHRHALHTIYAFARMADDFADEPVFEGKREQALAFWREQLACCTQQRSQNELFAKLGQVINGYDLPISCFHRLLDAFEQDVRQNRYAGWDDLMAYAALSANPVGQLYLRIFGYADPNMDYYSDCICSALQLTNFWQDISVDLEKNRVYLPQDDLESHGIKEDHIYQRESSADFEEMMLLLIDRTQKMFDVGEMLLPMLSGRLRWEIKVIWLGGVKMLAKVKCQRGRLLTSRPSFSKIEKASLFLRVWF